MKVKNLIERKRHLAELRARRVRARVQGTEKIPRLSVKRSLKHVYAQLIDDAAGKTLAAASDFDIKEKFSGLDLAKEVGKILATRAKEKGIETVVFDRGSYRYHGLVAALADGARENGMNF
ncbi:MAG: 50S ribosomal protein L18 [Candidatus Uhrbacteria bacterium GW2011_GWE2_45_35]|uniref:Large ribosomal subunit protein uL18 n=2 Tax=Candidatus Uhriibacteriota TaxID=1752732 RepID=A0A0G1LT49_9BACT|nr:MAG: 50S ribosomal protein L18 [Candidatus Uhrbacteria bacterium GW2011_GWF2_44_350]KKU09243.1 MAG: 50S ribosomal protein L18 [Candidatus Uhrbacteria bacterium GW2011_GWE2_45_35]HBR80474.1 50S ribosomal protein L18 [Candidatus Uhrbacteria bacterium]HCU31541.1 50S ribosomal protein L18 [Candidatus Uhrbacteria bacterium]